MIVTTAAVMMLGMWLPFSPIGQWLGFAELPSAYWPLLALTIVCYGLLTQGVKMWLFRKGWV